MAFIPSPHSARIVVTWALASQTWSNVFHATKDGFTTQDMQDLADDIDTWVGTQWIGNMPSDVGYQSTTIYDIRTSGGAVVSQNANAGVGSTADDVVPISTAIVVTLRTATRGRSGRGRVYFAGLGTLSMDNGSWKAGAEIAAESYVDGIRDQIVANNWVWCIRSIQQDNAPLNPAVMRPVTSFEVRDPRPGVQRRRIDRP